MQDPENSSAEAVLRRFDEQHNKYKFMECFREVGLQRVIFYLKHNLFSVNTEEL